MAQERFPVFSVFGKTFLLIPPFPASVSQLMDDGVAAVAVAAADATTTRERYLFRSASYLGT